MSKVYILQLENNKFYIGKTYNLQHRLAQHFAGIGSAWTKKFKPSHLISSFPGDGFDEESTTLRAMAKHGIESVRGGSYSKIVLNENEQNHIVHVLRSAQDKCYHCDSTQHFSNTCSQRFATQKEIKLFIPNTYNQTQSENKSFNNNGYESMLTFNHFPNSNHDDVQLLKKCKICCNKKILTEYLHNINTADQLDDCCLLCMQQLADIDMIEAMDMT